MKKYFLSVFVVLFALFLSRFAVAENNNMNNKKILVVYYSLSGNTEIVANEIQKMTGGDIFELQTVQSYPTNYKEQTEQAKKEIQDGYKPNLKGKIDNIAKYDVIFVGSPCWWGTYAPAVSTFLASYNLSGKTIVPFMTHGGSGLGRSVADMKKALPNSTILDGLAIRGSRANDSQSEVRKFIDELKI